MFRSRVENDELEDAYLQSAAGLRKGPTCLLHNRVVPMALSLEAPSRCPKFIRPERQ